MTTPASAASVLEATALATEHLDLLVLGGVRDVHAAVSERVHTVLDRVAGGPAPRPFLAHRLHDGIATSVYVGIGLGLRATALAMRQADKLGVGPRIEASPRGRFVVSAVNGLIGDKLVADGSPLAIEIGVRRDGRDVALTPAGLAEAFPEPSDAIVVFLHGLCETESYWDRRSRPKREDGSTTSSYGTRLAEDEGWTPVYVRANTGLSLAETGVALSSLLTRLVQDWPTEVRRIALVGHSMGALIARAACAVALDVDEPWTERVTDIVTLGGPHTGSPVERSIARGIRLAAHAPELMPLARVFEQRSVGVLDLHDGMPEDVAAVPHARYHLVAATLGKSPTSPMAATIGDYLVPYRSAVGLLPGDVEIFPGADVLHVPGADHFDLLNHDDVYAALRGWLANTRS
ncbi:alpha/beta hydrolase [Nocardioides marmoriginsengisoli]|uniref:Alpha/beta hydrolase n=1 Tax=Nocardioides marmoriginsengisoli TaxID=661483 RepID=A0A3N0CJT6_9ACTN|nr:alpha/beta fold hydrolase [Nocardioides marmoriginsengisoli]RNL63203.1 alpha/beta hydrolase [Nocardioides marmoriginsengisoli]